MKKMLRKIFFRMKELSPSDKISIVSAIIAGFSLIIAGISLGWSIYTNHGQDSQWKASFEEQQAVVAILQEDNEALNNTLYELKKQNTILEDDNKALNNTLDELIKQNAILEDDNKTFQNMLDQLREQTEISEANLNTLLSEKSIQCRISYLCCWYDSLWVLRDELEKDNVLIVKNDLAKMLDFEYIENAAPYDHPESYRELTNEFNGLSTPIIVLLKIDLTSNGTVLTQDLVLEVSEVKFSKTVPTALSKLAMYSATTGYDHDGELHDVEQYKGEQQEIIYTFSDQLISDRQYTTILCPVMVQATLEGKGTAKDSLLTPCTSTYKFVCIPKSISFTDLRTNQTIIKRIRDINDSAAITEYRALIGYG